MVLGSALWRAWTCLCENECVCLEFVPAGVTCLCPYDNMLPIGPVSLTHALTISASPPTQANKATRAINGNSTARPLHMHLTRHTHITPHSVPPKHQPQIQRHGTHAAHIQLKPRSRGNPPAPVMKPRHRSAGVMGRNKQNRRNLGRSKLRTRSHTCPFCVATEMVK